MQLLSILQHAPSLQRRSWSKIERKRERRDLHSREDARIKCRPRPKGSALSKAYGSARGLAFRMLPRTNIYVYAEL